MFSIIIPLYNKAPYIEKALHSVLTQTYKEFEIIVIDDGSTDIQEALQPPKGGVKFTYSDIEQMIEGKGKLIRQKNQGVSTARNNAVKLAKYPYLCFLDADDWWAPTFLEEMKSLIETFPKAGIYGSSYYKVKNGQHIPANIGVEANFERGLINYCQVYAKTLWMPLWTGAVVIPKHIFEQEQGFKPTLKLGEDFDLWIRIALKHPVALLNKPLAYYNQDVEIENRAVNRIRRYKKEEYVTFNFDFLNEYEKSNVYLKKLLDNLRVLSLTDFRLNKFYVNEVNDVISKVDFANVNKYYHFFYKYPLPIVRLYHRILIFGSKIKKQLNEVNS